MDLLVFGVIFWVVPIFVGHSMGKSKRREGIWYGLLLGWVGVLILALLAPRPEPSAVERLGQLEKRGPQFTPDFAEQKAALEAEITEAARGYRECPFCKERMWSDASVCPHCQRDVEPLMLSASTI